MSDFEESYFKSHDHHRLFYSCHKAKNSKAILVFVHGLNEHSGRYQNPIDWFKKDFDLYLFDQRGFGKSDGVRSHVENFSDYCEDLHEFIKYISARQKQKKIIVVGHSMGGQVVINYAAHYSDSSVKAFILSSPNIRVAMKIHPLKKWAGKMVSKLAPKFRIPSELDASCISRDKSVVKAYQKDPFVRSDLTCNLATEILDNQNHILELSKNITKPFLLMHGGSDEICSPEGTKDFYKMLPGKIKQLKIYNGMYHEIFNEFGKEEVLQDMADFIKNLP